MSRENWSLAAEVLVAIIAEIGPRPWVEAAIARMAVRKPVFGPRPGPVPNRTRRRRYVDCFGGEGAAENCADAQADQPRGQRVRAIAAPDVVVVLDVAPPARPVGYRPRPWTEDWFAYCHSRYRSFNPRSGTYLGYDGYEHFCR